MFPGNGGRKRGASGPPGWRLARRFSVGSGHFLLDLRTLGAALEPRWCATRNASCGLRLRAG